LRRVFSIGGGEVERSLSPSSVAVTVSKGKPSASSSSTFWISAVVWALERSFRGRWSSDGISLRPQSKFLLEQWMHFSFPARKAH
jgi:hypothetical protein